MKLINNILLVGVIALFGIVIYFGLTGGWSNLFLLPILTISGFALFYLHSQIEKEDLRKQEKAVELAIEDKEAEIWIKDTLVPQTISYSKRNRRTLIVYSFIFFISVYFLWQFISSGLFMAIRGTIYACILLLAFIYYIYIMPRVFNWISKKIPGFLQKYKLGEWGRAYIFLLPVTYLSYLIYPLENFSESFNGKILFLPLFIIIYTFLFLGLYSIIYLNKEIKKDEKKQLEKQIKDLM